jgi:hypothetical protein
VVSVCVDVPPGVVVEKPDARQKRSRD